MMFQANDGYWIVGDDTDRFWSSAARDYVDTLPEGVEPARISSEAALWNVLSEQAPECLPESEQAQDARKEHELSKADRVLFQIAFLQENRLRVLEGKQEVSAAQFKSAVKNRL